MFERTPEDLVAEVASIVEVVDYPKGRRIFDKLDPEPRSAPVERTLDTRLFRLDGDLFTQLMAANVDIVRGVLHVLCERLRLTSAAAGRP